MSPKTQSKRTNGTRGDVAELRFRVLIGALFSAVMLLVLAAVPRPRTGTDGSLKAARKHAPVQAAISQESNPRLLSSHAHLGETLRITLVTQEGASGIFLASPPGPPTTIGPYSVAVSSDWLLLESSPGVPGNDRIDLFVPLPRDPAFAGQDFVVQAAVIHSVWSDVRWTPPLFGRMTLSPPVGRHVLLLRSTKDAGSLAHDVQATKLANTLSTFGHVVTIADDVLPSSLVDFDVLFDCRFSTPPGIAETERLVEFLEQQGGIFFIAGGPDRHAPFELRANWIKEFLVPTLGANVGIYRSLNRSGGMALEEVPADADPSLLSHPSAISGLRYHVEDEGYSFGPASISKSGLPFIASTGATRTVYGMTFKPSDFSRRAVRGRLAVLFNGAPDALVHSINNPNVATIFVNLPWFLDR